MESGERSASACCEKAGKNGTDMRVVLFTVGNRSRCRSSDSSALTVSHVYSQGSSGLPFPAGIRQCAWERPVRIVATGGVLVFGRRMRSMTGDAACQSSIHRSIPGSILGSTLTRVIPRHPTRAARIPRRPHLHISSSLRAICRRIRGIPWRLDTRRSGSRPLAIAI